MSDHVERGTGQPKSGIGTGEQPAAPLSDAAHQPLVASTTDLLLDDSSPETMAAWLDDLSDCFEGEPNNHAWNLQTIAKRVRALAASLRGDGVRERDKLFCMALIGSGIDTRDMAKVLRVFNEMRPDRNDEWLAQMRAFDAECERRLAALASPVPPKGSRPVVAVHQTDALARSRPSGSHSSGSQSEEPTAEPAAPTRAAEGVREALEELTQAVEEQAARGWQLTDGIVEAASSARAVLSAPAGPSPTEDTHTVTQGEVRTDEPLYSPPRGPSA